MFRRTWNIAGRCMRVPHETASTRKKEEKKATKNAMTGAMKKKASRQAHDLLFRPNSSGKRFDSLISETGVSLNPSKTV